MQLTQKILLITFILCLIFGKWVGKAFQWFLKPLVNNPWGAVFITMAIAVFAINIVNIIIDLGRMKRG